MRSRHCVGTDVEADDDRGGSLGEHDVALVDGADRTVNNVDAHLFVAELFERLAHCLHGALHIRLDDDLQLLDLAELELVKEVVERDLGLGVEDLFLLLRLSLLNERSCQALVADGVKGIAADRHLVQTGDLDRHGGTCLLHALALVVGHDADSADGGTGDDDVALVQRAVLHQHRGDGASALVQTRLDDRTLGGAVGIGFELLHLGDERDHFEQVVQTLFCLGGNGDTGCVAAPLLGDQLIFGELLLDLFGVRAHLIHFVDGNNDRNACRLGVVDRLNGLRHGVEEGDRLAVDLHTVGADVLGDAACLACGDVGVTDGVQNGGLAVVNVTHNDHDRRSADEVRLVVLAVVDELFFDGDDDLLFDLGVELHCDQRGGVKVDGVGGGDHGAHEERLFDDLGDRGFQAQRQLVDGDLVGYLHRDGLLLALHGDSFQTLRLGLALALLSAALLLGAVGEFLLFGGVVAVGAARLGGVARQIVILGIVALHVHIGGAGVDDLALALVVRGFALLLLGLGRLGSRCGLAFLAFFAVLFGSGLVCRRLFVLLRLLLDRLLRLFELGVSHRKIGVEVLDGMLSGEHVKQNVQLALGERGHGLFVYVAVFFEYLGNLLVRQGEVVRRVLYFIFNHRILLSY